MKNQSLMYTTPCHSRVSHSWLGSILTVINNTRPEPFAKNVILKRTEAHSIQQRGSRVGTLGTLKGVRPVWGRLGRNLFPKGNKALPFQTIHDIWVLSRNFGFQGKVLADAIQATFKRRETEIPAEPPLALTKEFYQDPSKQAQWTAFLRRTRIDVAEPFSNIIKAINSFLMPPADGQPFDKEWPAGGPWQSK